ncbi:desulfoferrodoxin [Cetobacterium sp. 8H]|uniref:desulfoferrodoxin family protein n=1 Tax=Cetobacterium sp. 8H TaxID=2759681 RepID=UPI00163C8157|nr:desulfoferrodoxin family protein [Cetobacterium sp. 8H]MBC2850826.1 desulfoferrodoxin [Cetobacterium sp. 8H]
MKVYDILKVKDNPVIVEVLVADKEGVEVPGLELLKEKSQDAATEKHVPYVEEKEDGYLVKVGKETAHPMTAEHYIQMIEICVGEFLYRKYLKPGEAPEAYFKVPKGESVCAREYCNIHGLWSN